MTRKPQTRPQSTLKKNGPVRVGEILPQLMAKYGFQRRQATEELQNAWNEIIAELLPESLRSNMLLGNVRRGVLTVKLQHTALVQELSFYEARIVEQIRQRLPHSNIRRIKFIAG